MAPEPKPMKLPLSIYVVFHPDSEEATALADALHDWFRLKQDDGDSTEAGLPIWYRSWVEGGEVAPSIEWSGAELNAVVILADDHLVADPTWRAATEKLCEADSGTTRIFPVALSRSAYRLSFLFETRNQLSAGAGASASASEASRRGAWKKRARTLRRNLTEAVTRELRKDSYDHDDDAPLPLTVFLSHAKADGTEIATALRSGMADYSQLKPWYDANDLPPSYKWEHRIVSAAATNTAALVSVVTDVYASRHWCRHEVNTARAPREVTMAGVADEVSAWTVQPAVAVVRAGTKWSRPMAQLAQVPRLGWRERLDPRQVEDVVDRLLLETLLVSFYRRLAPMLAQRYLARTAEQRGGKGLAVLTWVPDPWSLTLTVDELRKKAGRREIGACRIAYPGCGLRAAERAELDDVLRVLGGLEEAPFELVSHERLGQVGMERIPRGFQIALSGSGGDDDVRSAGVGARHIEDLVVRLSRRLLEEGARIHFGGTLTNYKSNLTQALIEVAQGWTSLASQTGDSEEDPSAEEGPPKAPLVNYAAWPNHRLISLSQRAELTGICAFEHVDLDDGEVPPAAAFDKESDRHKRWTADALTRMREVSSEATDLRIVVGGKVDNWMGWLPGILEEVVCSLAVGQLPVVLGGFGGNAGQIAAFLADPNAEWPEALGVAAALRNPALSWAVALKRAGEVEERNQAAESALKAFRAQLHGAAGTAWPFRGVERRDVIELLTMQSPARVIDRILWMLSAMASEGVRPGGGPRQFAKGGASTARSRKKPGAKKSGAKKAGAKKPRAKKAGTRRTSTKRAGPKKSASKSKPKRSRR